MPLPNQTLSIEVPTPSAPSTNTMVTFRFTVSSQAVNSFASYRLVLYGNGNVVYEGSGSGIVEGKRTTSVDPAQIDALLYEFGKLDFLNLEGLPEDLSLDPLDYLFPYDLSDDHTLLGITVGLKIGDRHKVVLLTPDAPAGMSNLTHQILVTADALKWVGGLTPYPTSMPESPLPTPTP